MLAVGARWPEVTLPAADGGAVRVGGRGPGPAAVAWLHEAACGRCAAARAAWAPLPARLAPWGGRLVLVLPTAVGDAPAGIEVALDPEGRWAAAAGVPAPAAAVADEWGEVAALFVGHDALPTAATLEDWVRFLAIQCPECTGVEGAWRSL